MKVAFGALTTGWRETRKKERKKERRQKLEDPDRHEGKETRQ
jgi:hypothetical protein